MLSWETNPEASNLTYYIERSANQQQWVTIDSVLPASHNSRVQSFTTIDKKPLDNTNFYRLKQVDNNGNHYYSTSTHIKHLPLQNELNISIQPGSKTLVLLSPYPIESCTVYHSSGKNIGTYINQQISNKMLVPTENFPDGLFVFQANTSKKRHSKQILLKK